MAKKQPRPVPPEEQFPAPEVTEDAGGSEPAASKPRGPKGVVPTAVITLIAGTNPKREGSKAQQAFACYVDGMTVADFCAAVDALGLPGGGTPHLVYDAKHGFISIEGYNPGEIITPKPKEPKEPKAPRGKKTAKAETPDPEVEAEAQTETMD